MKPSQHIIVFLLCAGMTAPLGQVHALDPTSRARLSREQSAAAQLDSVGALILQKTNAFRERHALSTLRRERKLDSAASKFAEYMARTNRYGHSADGKTPSERAAAAGYEYCIIRENLSLIERGKNLSSAELAAHFMNSWENSEPHLKNLLGEIISEAGIGVAKREDSPTYFAVQLFGEPKSTMYKFTVENHSSRSTSYTLTRGGETSSFDLPAHSRRFHKVCGDTVMGFAFRAGHTVDVQPNETYSVRDSLDGLRVVKS